MYVRKGGDLYGFCPAKATWDHEATSVFQMLIISAETGTLPEAGGFFNQPAWFMDVLAWFLPKYDFVKFASKADMILSGQKPSKRPGSNISKHPKRTASR